MKLLKDFRDFVLRGNVVDLAVGIIIGAAFTAVVNALVTDIITPLIPTGKLSLSDYFYVIPFTGGKLQIGAFVNSVISFLIVASVVFFFVVRPVNTLMSRFKPKVVEVATTRECPYCLSHVPIKATKCAYCTSELSAAA